ncbi:MAG: ParB/RepB/Spo0J family partition protein [Candidatus Aminicenantia bacterium]
MRRKIGLPESVKMRHDPHFVELISSVSKGPLIRMISIDKIVPNPNQPRNEIGDISDLAASIRAKGIIEPIIVRPKGEKYEIISGERRYRAALEAGLKEIPSIEMDVSDNEALELSLIENLQRKDLHPFEEAQGLRALVEIYSYSHQDIAERIGKSRTSITETLSLDKIPSEVKKLCLQSGINAKTILVQIARQPDMERMIELINKIKKERFTREDTREFTRQIKEKKVKVKPFVFKFKPPSREFSLNIMFKKPKVEKQEIIKVLEELIKKLKEEL